MSTDGIAALRLCKEMIESNFTELDIACVKDVKEAYYAVTEALLNAEWEDARTELSEAEAYDREQCLTAQLLDKYGVD